MSKIVEFAENPDLYAVELSDACFFKQGSAVRPIFGLFSVIVR